MRLKSILSILICLFILTGCQGKELTIKLWEFPRWKEADQLDRFVWIKRMIRQFEAENPGVKIELTELTWERGQDKIKIALAAGAGPDLTAMSIPIQYIQQGMVEPVDEHLSQQDRADYLPGALKSYTYQGKVWGFPWLMSGELLYLNLDLFKERGVEPPRDGRWSYEEFLTRMKSLTFLQNGKRNYGFGFCLNPGETLCWPFLYSDGAKALSDDLTSYTFNSQEGISGLEKLRDMVHKYRVASPESGGLKQADLWQAFRNQRTIAVAPFGIWAIPALKPKPSDKPGDSFNFAVANFPSGKTGQPLTFIGINGFVVFKQKNAAKRQTCLKLARFLTNSQNQKALVNYGTFPTRRSTGNLYPDDPWMTKASEIFQAGITVPPQPQWPRIDERIQKELQLSLLGQKTAQEALNEAGRQVDLILKEKPGPKKGCQILGLISLLVLGLLLAIWLIYILSSAKSRMAYLFLLPGLIILAIFLGFPVWRAFLLAFQRYEPGQGIWENWVGLENFKTLFRDEIFWQALGHTWLYTLFVVPINLFISLVLASLIYPLSRRMRTFFRAAYYLPGVASVVVIAMIWKWLFDYNFGFLNQLLSILHLPTIQWLTDTRVALYSIILSSILHAPGGPMLIYLAAMSTIPESLYEASLIDGASRLRQWWHITIPLLRPTTLFLVVTLTIASFQVFAQVLLLTDGGPGYASSVLVHRIYTVGFRDFDFGLASSMSLILFIVIMTIAAFQFKFFKKDWEY